jgi:hypothetical protein
MDKKLNRRKGGDTKRKKRKEESIYHSNESII